MLSKGNFFPEQDSQEEIVLFIRRHWMGAIREWFFGLIMILFIILFILGAIIGQLDFIITQTSKYYVLFGISAFAMVTMGYLLTAWINYYLDVTIITKRHLINIRHEELLTRNVAEQSLLRVQDVSVRVEGGFQAWLKFGTVYVETAGEQPNFKMKNIPNPYVVANYILKLHEEMVSEGDLVEEFKNGVGMDKPHNNIKTLKSVEKNKEIPIQEDIHEPGKDIITIQGSGKISEEKNKTLSKEIKQIENFEEPKQIKVKESIYRQIDRGKRENKNHKQGKTKKQDSYMREIKEGEEIKF